MLKEEEPSCCWWWFVRCQGENLLENYDADMRWTFCFQKPTVAGIAGLYLGWFCGNQAAISALHLLVIVAFLANLSPVDEWKWIISFTASKMNLGQVFDLATWGRVRRAYPGVLYWAAAPCVGAHAPANPTGGSQVVVFRKMVVVPLLACLFSGLGTELTAWQLGQEMTKAPPEKQLEWKGDE